MLGPNSGWPEYKDFLLEIEDPDTARDFLQHIQDLGYVIVELKQGEEIQNLPDGIAVGLAKSYWPVVFLAEYPDYGEYEQ